MVEVGICNSTEEEVTSLEEEVICSSKAVVVM